MSFSDLLFTYISFYFLFLFFLTMSTDTSTRAVYSREELLALSRIGRGIKQLIPTKLKKLYRGCRAGAKRKAKRDNRRWRYKPFLLSVIMGNANSLPNKCHELEVTTGVRAVSGKAGSLSCFLIKDGLTPAM